MLDWPMRGQMQMATGELGFHHAVRTRDRSRERSLRRGPDASPERSAHRRASGVIKLSERRARPLPAQPRAARARDGSAHRLQQSRVQLRARRPARARSRARARSSGATDLPYGDIRLDGENLRLVDVPEARIDASPDLDFRIAGRDIHRQGRGQTTAGAHPARGPHQRRAAFGGRKTRRRDARRSRRIPSA